MPVNSSFAGRTYPPTAPYAVGREKIREFAEAVGAADPVHTDRDVARARGYRDVIATPTFAVLVAQQCDKQLITDPEAGIDFSRVVHGEQRFAHTRAVRAGDVLTVTVTLESVKSAGGHDMVTSRSDVATVEGEHVATAWSTLVVRGGE